MLHATVVAASQVVPAPAVLEADGLVLDDPTEKGRVWAVEGVGYIVRQGERLVLIGASGCGKPSILRQAVDPAASRRSCGWSPASSGRQLAPSARAERR